MALPLSPGQKSESHPVPCQPLLPLNRNAHRRWQALPLKGTGSEMHSSERAERGLPSSLEFRLFSQGQTGNSSCSGPPGGVDSIVPPCLLEPYSSMCSPHPKPSSYALSLPPGPRLTPPLGTVSVVSGTTIKGRSLQHCFTLISFKIRKQT